jgi:hypothetical protein
MVASSVRWDILSAGEKIIRVTSPAPREIWRELMGMDPEAIVPQSPEWVDIICSTGKYKDASYLYEFPDGSKQLLPMVRLAHIPTLLATQASMPPSWGMGGLIGSRPAQPEDISIICNDISKKNILSTSIRPNPIHSEAWTCARPDTGSLEPRLAHILDLQPGLQEIWTKKFSHKVRTAIHKAERSGLTVECDRSGRYVPLYYELMLKSVDRWAAQQHEPRAMARWRAANRDPMEKIQRIAKGMGSTFNIWVAWYANQPAAAVLTLKGRNIYGFKSAMDKPLAGPTCATDLIHWLIIQDACQSRCGRYCLGESGRSASLALYKEHLGAQAYPYAEYYFERFPLTTLDRKLRRIVKWVIGFKEPQ